MLCKWRLASILQHTDRLNMPLFRESVGDECERLGDVGEDDIVKVYWFALDPSNYPGFKPVPRDDVSAKPRWSIVIRPSLLLLFPLKLHLRQGG